MRRKASLYTYSRPGYMEDYLRYNGWHFNRKACEYAVSMMRGKDGNRIQPLQKAEVDDMLARFGVQLEDKNSYDYVYVANMCKADFLKSSIADDAHMALYVKDTMEDADAADGMVFARWCSDMRCKGEMILWDELV